MVNAYQFCLSPRLFANAFPFHFVSNQNRKILQTGEVLQRVIPAELIGSRFEEHFQIICPSIKPDFDTIKKQSRSFFMLECLINGMQLRGQMICSENQENMFFLGSPWVTDIASLAPLGIKLKDFAIHDPIVDFIFLLQAKSLALMDAKKTIAPLHLPSFLALASIPEAHKPRLDLALLILSTNVSAGFDKLTIIPGSLRPQTRYLL